MHPGNFSSKHRASLNLRRPINKPKHTWIYEKKFLTILTITIAFILALIIILKLENKRGIKSLNKIEFYGFLGSFFIVFMLFIYTIFLLINSNKFLELANGMISINYLIIAIIVVIHGFFSMWSNFLNRKQYNKEEE